jgi:threonylcarbamoyladenosine tRNA methylthiotransferase MtaB
MKKTIAFYTLGCKVNQSDSASMENLFAKAGYTVVPFEEGADVIVINTCVVTNTGQRKSRQMINRAIRHNPEALVVVAGCYPQTAPEEVAAITGVDLLIGNQDRPHIVELVEEALHKSAIDTKMHVHKLESNTRFEELEGGNEEHKTRAYLKIQEGCNQFCTYCIIPYARGPLRSRSLSNITSEVEKLVQSGYKEVVLIGIHLGCYGHDFADGTTLYDAVAAALKVQGLQRLRLGSLESVEVEDRLLRLMVEDKRFCMHLHLPLQTGCDKILKAMHRPYDTKKFAALLEHIRALVPEIALTTDVIVGFPGETDEDFKTTCAFAESCGFAKMHIFPYSERKGTPAAQMPAKVPENIKAARAKELAAIDERLHQKYREEFIGQTVRVLWEQPTERGLIEGLSDNYLRIYAPGTKELCGKISEVKLEKLHQEGLQGTIV